MKISAKAEYACFAMVELAAHYAEGLPVRVASIAEAHGIPDRFLVQILLQLKSAGLAASSRGASGGYQLARPPEEISLAHVVDAIDRAPTPRRVATTRKKVPVSPAESPTIRTVRAAWKDIEVRERRMLEELTLAELVRRAQEHSDYSYQI
jgi:Rrf2 family protein